MDFSQKVPFSVKASIGLIGLYVLVIVLINTRELLLPFIYASIISILLNPTVNYLVKHKINRALAIAVVLLFTLLTIILIILLLSSQASLLSEAYPRLSAKFQLLLKQGVSWISSYFNLSVRSINRWINDTQSDLINNSNAAIGFTLSTLGGILSTVFLTPVYVFMLLFYRLHLIQFIHKLFGSNHESKITEILSETKGIIQAYLLGLSLEFLIVATLNSFGLLFLQIDYAVLLGILGALLNIIPYIGGLIAVALFMIIALLTKAPVYVFYVFVVYFIIQFIDNNFIVPKVIGGKVRLNALICLLAVITGAAIWGIPGMFLAIPTTAVMKLIFERVNGLKPWGFLFGDTAPILLKLKPRAKKKV